MILTNTLHIAYLAKMPDGTTARTETESNTVRTEIISYAVFCLKKKKMTWFYITCYSPINMFAFCIL